MQLVSFVAISGSKERPGIRTAYIHVVLNFFIKEAMVVSFLDEKVCDTLVGLGLHYSSN